MIVPLLNLVKYFATEVPFVSDLFLRWKIRQQFELGEAEGILPKQLAIETTCCCNAKCRMCPQASLKRQKGLMSREVHCLIVDKVAKWGAPISSITHAGLGEPLLDNSLEEKIRYEKGVFKGATVTIFTNASLLDERRGRSLISAGLDGISISVQGFRKETYEKIMRLSYEQTQQNISNLLKLNRDAGSPIRVQVSLVPTELHAKEEIEEFVQYWTGRVDAVVIPPWISWGGFFQQTSKKTQWPCRYIWEVLQVDWDGTVKMCCEDYDTRFPMGDLKTQSLREIFNSPRMQRQRKDQVYGNFKWPEICQNCIEAQDVAREFWKSASLIVTEESGN